MARTALAAVAITGFAVFLPLASAVPAFADDCLATPLLGGGLVGDTVCGVTDVVTGEGALLPDLGSEPPTTSTPAAPAPAAGSTPTTGGTDSVTPVLIPTSPITIPSVTLPVISGGSTAPVTTAPVTSAPVVSAPVVSNPVVSTPAASGPAASAPATAAPAAAAPSTSGTSVPPAAGVAPASLGASPAAAAPSAAQAWATGLLSSSAWATGATTEAIAAPAGGIAPATVPGDAGSAQTAFTVSPVKTGMTADPSGAVPVWALAALVLLASLGGAGYLLRHDFRLLRRQA